MQAGETIGEDVGEIGKGTGLTLSVAAVVPGAYALFTEVRFRRLEARAAFGERCGAGRLVVDCERRIGEPSWRHGTDDPGRKVAGWSSGRAYSSSTIVLVSEGGIIRETLDLDREANRAYDNRAYDAERYGWFAVPAGTE